MTCISNLQVWAMLINTAAPLSVRNMRLFDGVLSKRVCCDFLGVLHNAIELRRVVQESISAKTQCL